VEAVKWNCGFSSSEKVERRRKFTTQSSIDRGEEAERRISLSFYQFPERDLKVLRGVVREGGEANERVEMQSAVVRSLNIGDAKFEHPGQMDTEMRQRQTSNQQATSQSNTLNESSTTTCRGRWSERMLTGVMLSRQCELTV
jgi:hypothetical protein